MEKKIEKWLEKGVISKEIAMALLADVKEEKKKTQKVKINITIYTIAVILIGIGIITFISANDWILELLNASDILKIILMFIVTGSSLYGGYKLAYENKKFPKLGHTLIVLSSLLIGGTYALIGQTYNINANSSGLFFLWLISILPLAYVFKNYVINIISIILFILGIIFFYIDLALDSSLTWTIFIPIVTGAFLYTIGNISVILKKFNNFSLAYKLVGLFPIFTTLLILTCSVKDSYQQTSAFYIAPLIILIIANVVNFAFNDKNNNNLIIIETVFISGILFFLLLLLICPVVNTVFITILVNAILIGIITFGFKYGYKFENARIIGLTNWFLTLYLIVNYTRWGWSYMDKSLFFILGGLSLLGIGIFLEKRRKEIIKDK